MQHKGIPASRSVSSEAQLKSLYANECCTGNKCGLQGHDLIGISEVSTDWKKRSTTPIFRKVQKDDLGNYMSVSLYLRSQQQCGADPSGKYVKAHQR